MATATACRGVQGTAGMIRCRQLNPASPPPPRVINFIHEPTRRSRSHRPVPESPVRMAQDPRSGRAASKTQKAGRKLQDQQTSGMPERDHDERSGGPLVGMVRRDGCVTSCRRDGGVTLGALNPLGAGAGSWPCSSPLAPHRSASSWSFSGPARPGSARIPARRLVWKCHALWRSRGRSCFIAANRPTT